MGAFFTIERWRPGDERPAVLSEVITWQPLAGAAPLCLDLPSQFARVHGEAL